jgi:hypothetical protein
VSVVPWPSATGQAADEPSPKPPPKPRRWWNDPVIVVGAAVPAVVLAWFAFYLAGDRARKEAARQAAELHAQATQLDAEGNSRWAYEKFGQAWEAAQRANLDDEDVARIAKSAKDNRTRLFPAIQAQLEREEAERASREEEARQTGEADRMAAVARREAAKAEADRREEEARLSKFTASVTGGAFVLRKSGQSDILRGLTVAIIPSHIERYKIADVFSGIASKTEAMAKVYEESEEAGNDNGFSLLDRARARVVAGWLVKLADQPADQPADCKALHDVIRAFPFRDEDEDGAERMDAIENDRLWPAVVKACRPRIFNTDIEGRYRVDGVKGGTYYLWAIHRNAFSLMEWLIPLKIDRDGEFKQDFFNESAVEILNRKL